MNNNSILFFKKIINNDECLLHFRTIVYNAIQDKINPAQKIIRIRITMS